MRFEINGGGNGLLSCVIDVGGSEGYNSISGSQSTGFKHINVSDMAKENDLCESYDNELESYVIDEDKVISQENSLVN